MSCPSEADASSSPLILVVDDSCTYRTLISSILKKSGYSILEADSGQSAITLLTQHHIQIVISDWDMPNIDGAELCSYIRQHEFNRYIYFILLTVRKSTDDLIIGMESGADEFLSKPIDAKELHARLRSALRVLHLESSLAERNRQLHIAYKQIETDLKAAAQLQLSLLPVDKVAIEGWSYDWLFQPSTYVSGDMLSLFSLDDEHIAFYSIDVAGHGIGAAMLSVALARMLSQGRNNHHLLKYPTDKESISTPYLPADVISELNRQFQISTTVFTNYFTIVYGYINKKTGDGVLTQAGHPNPILIQKEGTASIVGNGGFPVGLIESSLYENVYFHMEPGSRLYLYTDGIIECEAYDKSLFDEQHLIDFLLSNYQQPLPNLIKNLKTTLHHWHRTVPDSLGVFSIENIEFADDVSIIALERNLMTPLTLTGAPHVNNSTNS